MTAIKGFSSKRSLCAALLVGTSLGGFAGPAFAQDTAAQPSTEAAAPSQPAPVATAPMAGTIRSISVTGSQRLEPETVLSYTSLRQGEPYNREKLDQAIKDLYNTELFADVKIRDDQGNLTIEVQENPVINRIILEGNKRLKDDKIAPEIRLAPRQIFTRSKARADVARIIELYRRQGRFAASVEPKIVKLDQNRVDVVFEITEGPKSKVQQINILGNKAFSDAELRSQMSTKQSRLFRFFSSGTSYDPDRLAFDQQKLRQFYLTQGYADFRVISAVAELTPDKRDFIITYVVEEGDRYKFGDVKVESEIRDLKPDQLTVPIHKGDWYDAKKVEDTVTLLTETAGLFGYAFAQVDPEFKHDKENLTMGVTFKIENAPRVYVERIDINGNTVTHDKVIRREFRLAEGDPFNSVQVKRSQDRIQSLGFFQDNLEIKQTQGSAPDRVILGVDVEEKSTGQLQLSAGYSSLEHFIINASIEQRNFMGKGQIVRAAVSYSTFSKSVELGFTDPYVFDKNIALGGDIYRRDFSNFNFVNNNRNTTYKQIQTGGQIRAGVPLTEYLQLALRYGLNLDEISLDKSSFFSDRDNDGVLTCDPLLAGRYLCDALGNRITSSVGYSLLYSTLNNNLRPSSGERILFNQDFAGLGGDAKYIKSKLSAAKFWGIGSGFVFSLSGEAGYIHSFEKAGPGIDPVRITDRFFLGEPDLRGFDIRGVGPRVQRIPYDRETGELVTDRRNIVDDPLGGRAYYRARAEIEIPLGSTGKELGIRPSIFVDAGALFGLRKPILTEIAPDNPLAQDKCIDSSGNSSQAPSNSVCPTGSTFIPGIQPFKEVYLGDTPKPRVSIGFGVNWNSPFGPFRIDIAKALITAKGDDTKLITFNVGTPF